MTKVIKKYLENIPNSSGIYQMIDSKGDVIYVGKAKNLHKRVSSYTRLDLPYKNLLMVSLVQEVKIITTSSESEAFLLEASLIKKLQPKYNILLKDDKSFPYLKLRTDHAFPQILKYRGKIAKDDKLFGPYPSISSLDSVIEELHKIFKTRSCSDNFFQNRKRPCLQYQIKRCSAPCVGKISQEDYASSVSQIEKFLQGKTQELQADLAKKMEEYSENFEYERAAEIRDRIKALSYVQSKAITTDFNIENADVIALHEKHSEFVIQIMMFRSGGSSGGKTYFPTNTENASHSEIMETFLSFFYENITLPGEIILSHELENKTEMSSALSEIAKHKVKITNPNSNSSKYKLVQNALQNASVALDTKQKDLSTRLEILDKIQELFHVQDKIERIELYDNSHISGKFAVGGYVVVTREGFDKKSYRMFNIKQDQPKFGGDDYLMMKEVMTRRLQKLNSENKPSLIIIDGGTGQLNVVFVVMQELGVNIPLVGMSKGPDRNAGREIFHMIDKEPFTLDRNDPVMKYLQIMRDEVHNFAIKSHRKLRSKAIYSSELDKIEGIGEKRKKILLNYFGSIDRIKQATVEELSKAPNIGMKFAQKIYSEMR